MVRFIVKVLHLPSGSVEIFEVESDSGSNAMLEILSCFSRDFVPIDAVEIKEDNLDKNC